MCPAEISNLRDALSDIDARLVALLAERVSLARQVGTHKRTHGLATLDPKREAEVVGNAARLAREHGLGEEEIREIFWQVIAMSRRAQEQAP